MKPIFFWILTVGNALSVSLFGNSDPTYAAWQAVKCIPIQDNSNSSQTNCRRFDVSRTSRQNCRACLALCQCCVRLDCPRRHPYRELAVHSHSPSQLTIDSLGTPVSLQELEYKCFSKRDIPVPLRPTVI